MTETDAKKLTEKLNNLKTECIMAYKLDKSQWLRLLGALCEESMCFSKSVDIEQCFIVTNIVNGAISTTLKVVFDVETSNIDINVLK